MDLGTFSLSRQDIARKCIAVLGIRGSGKSNSSKVLIEEAIKEELPVTVIDPDAEYVELIDSLGGDVLTSKDDPLLTSFIHYRQSKNSVIDMSDWDVESFAFLFKYLTNLWELSKEERKDRMIVVEEAHEFIPQGKVSGISDVITRLALRGRKRGIGIVLISQRSAKVNKDVLTQSEIYLLHKVVHPVDLKVYREILPMKPKEVDALVPSLGVGEAILYMEGKTQKVKFRQSYHQGYVVPTSSSQVREETTI
ncbi:ATP-binding protein [Sulfuracidifex metallicus]|uniref:ATP-binding protein n=1 Tax=Sulfuracidifex metallicus TaxID=47303 RepID=UPI0022738259|nr:ATP-binding protein [Sulfuracidifex metallicus]MCY0849802.1 ATP-binding protein [Sulfuracidifex metallicus]